MRVRTDALHARQVSHLRHPEVCHALMSAGWLDTRDANAFLRYLNALQVLQMSQIESPFSTMLNCPLVRWLRPPAASAPASSRCLAAQPSTTHKGGRVPI